MVLLELARMIPAVGNLATLGLLLTVAPAVLYRSYAGAPDALDDQAWGGVIMWGVGGLADMIAVHAGRGGAVIALKEFPLEEIVAYGCVKPGAIEGRVVEKATGLPIPNAEVSILGRPGSAVTDAEGRFTWHPDPAPPFERGALREEVRAAAAEGWQRLIETERPMSDREVG